MKKIIIKFLLNLSLCMLFTPEALAADLIDIYNQALQSDPTYQAATSTRLSQRETLPQNVANLLPNLSATANTTLNIINTSATSGSSTAPPTPAGTQKYNSNGYLVTLTQPLLNFTSWMQVSQANATAKQADATFYAAGQQLIIDVAQAYFDVLQAQDTLRVTEAQKAAHARQLDQVQQRFKVGLDAVTSVYNAQAAYDSDIAQEIADQNALRNKQEALRVLTGQYYSSIEGLKIELPLVSPQPSAIDQWVATAEKQNFTYLAQRFATQAAREFIKVRFGGHLPSLNAVGTYQRTNSNSSGTASETAKAASLQLNVPIYSGGLVASQVRQAQDDYATQSANMEKTYRQTITNTRQFYNDVLAGISKIKADRQAIVSAQSSLDSTEESFKVGTRTIVDVLLAQQKLYEQKRIYAKDEYTYLLSTLQLKQAAGSLSALDLQAINAWLHARTENKVPTKK
jgi:outer membrane protein